MYCELRRTVLTAARRHNLRELLAVLRISKEQTAGNADIPLKEKDEVSVTSEFFSSVISAL